MREAERKRHPHNVEGREAECKAGPWREDQEGGRIRREEKNKTTLRTKY